MQVLNGFYCDGGKYSLLYVEKVIFRVKYKTKPPKIAPPPNVSVSVMIKNRPVVR